MALELTSAITAAAPEFRVTGTVPDTIEPGFRFRLDDELLSLQGFGEDESIRGGYARQWAPRDRQRWIVNRGIDSVAASHDAGTELLAANDAFGSSSDLTPPSPFSPGGGGLPTGWTQDPETGAVDTGGNDLLVPRNVAHGLVPTGGTTGQVLAKASDDDDDTTWSDAAPGLGAVLAESNDANGEDITNVNVLQITDDLDIGGELNHDGPTAGFFGAAPVARPEVPATPTEQDIVDALVTLGLITQAAP